MNGTGPDQSPGGINLPKAWDTTRGDPSVVVAVIDTGILPAHPDIAGLAEPHRGLRHDQRRRSPPMTEMGVTPIRPTPATQSPPASAGRASRPIRPVGMAAT